MKSIAQSMDMIERERVHRLWERHGKRLIKRYLTDAESTYVRHQSDAALAIADTLAAKRAVLRVLKTSVRKKVTWQDVEITHNNTDYPTVELTGECKRVAKKLKFADILLSISHTTQYTAATATAVNEAGKPVEIPFGF